MNIDRNIYFKTLDNELEELLPITYKSNYLRTDKDKVISFLRSVIRLNRHNCLYESFKTQKKYFTLQKRSNLQKYCDEDIENIRKKGKVTINKIPIINYFKEVCGDETRYYDSSNYNQIQHDDCKQKLFVYDERNIPINIFKNGLKKYFNKTQINKILNLIELDTSQEIRVKLEKQYYEEERAKAEERAQIIAEKTAKKKEKEETKTELDAREDADANADAEANKEEEETKIESDAEAKARANIEARAKVDIEEEEETKIESDADEENLMAIADAESKMIVEEEAKIAAAAEIEKKIQEELEIKNNAIKKYHENNELLNTKEQLLRIKQKKEEEEEKEEDEESKDIFDPNFRPNIKDEKYKIKEQEKKIQEEQEIKKIRNKLKELYESRDSKVKDKYFKFIDLDSDIGYYVREEKRIINEITDYDNLKNKSNFEYVYELDILKRDHNNNSLELLESYINYYKLLNDLNKVNKYEEEKQKILDLNKKLDSKIKMFKDNLKKYNDNKIKINEIYNKITDLKTQQKNLLGIKGGFYSKLRTIRRNMNNKKTKRKRKTNKKKRTNRKKRKNRKTNKRI